MTPNIDENDYDHDKGDYDYDDLKDEIPMLEFFDQVRREEKALAICKELFEAIRLLGNSDLEYLVKGISERIRKLFPQKGEES